MAGNVAKQTVSFKVAANLPLTLTSYTPTNGSSDIGSTFRPELFFSRPINTATLTATDFYATDSTGAVLPTTIVPANDGTYAWLFFTNPMPGASTITVTVDGSKITCADGTKLDAAGTGIAGSLLTTSFTTVSLALIPNTSLFGTIADPGPDLHPGTIDDVKAGPDGVLNTADDVYRLPIAGVTVSILGTNLTAITDATGKFSFPSVPTGDVKLDVNGRTATAPPTGYYFPDMTVDLNIRPGQSNTIMAAMAATGSTQPNLFDGPRHVPAASRQRHPANRQPHRRHPHRRQRPERPRPQPPTTPDAKHRRAAQQPHRHDRPKDAHRPGGNQRGAARVGRRHAAAGTLAAYV